MSLDGLSPAAHEVEVSRTSLILFNPNFKLETRTLKRKEKKKNKYTYKV